MRLTHLFVVVALGLLHGGVALAADSDGDGIADGRDNCARAANSDQLDSDADGLGNACDFDFNNDGRVDQADGLLLRNAMATQADDAAFPDAFDVDGDGLVAGTDWEAFVGALSQN